MSSTAKEFVVLCMTDMFKTSVQQIFIEWLLNGSKGVLGVWDTKTKIPCS